MNKYLTLIASKPKTPGYKYVKHLALFMALSFWVILTPGLAQKVTVSDEIPVRQDNAFGIIGKLNDQILFFRSKVNHNYEVQAFDENLMVSWTEKIELEDKKMKIIEVLAGADDFNIIYSFRKGGDVGIKVCNYDANAKLIDSVVVMTFENKYVTPRFQFEYSENKEIMLLYFIENQKEINAFAYDLKAKKKLWDQRFEPKDMNYFRDFEEILVDDAGNMFFILDKNNKKTKREEHYFQIFKVASQTGKVDFFKIPMDSLLTFDVHFSSDNLNQNLVAAGMYSDKNRTKADGYFFLTVNPQQPTNHKLSYEPFDEKVVANFMGRAGKSANGVTDAAVKEIVHRNDGGVLMIVERTKKYERRLGGARTGYTGDGRSFTVDYYYEDVLVVSIHPDGSEHWARVLHKKQYSQDDDGIYSSFFLVKTPKSLRLLFNDEIKHENTVSEYVISGNGNFDRNSVLSTDYKKLKLRFKDAMQVASNEIIVPSERKQNLKLIKVLF